MALRARIVPSGDQAAGAPVPRLAVRVGGGAAGGGGGGGVGSVGVLGGAEPAGPMVGDGVGSGEGGTGNAMIAKISSPSGSRPAMKRGPPPPRASPRAAPPPPGRTAGRR